MQSLKWDEESKRQIRRERQHKKSEGGDKQCSGRVILAMDKVEREWKQQREGAGRRWDFCTVTGGRGLIKKRALILFYFDMRREKKSFILVFG